MKKQRPCSQPDVRHLLIENLDHYELTRYRPNTRHEAEWVHWREERLPNPGDILQLCDRPDYPRSLKVSR